MFVRTSREREATTMVRLLKKHGGMLIGVTLPALLVLFFVVASKYPLLLAEKPKYDFIFYTTNYSYHSNREIRLYVENGKLVGKALKHESNTSNYSRRGVDRIFYYDAETRNIREIPIMPDAVELRETDRWYTFNISETEGLKIDPSLRAPDGYEFGYYTRSSVGPLPGLIFGSRYRDGLTLSKEGAHFRVSTGKDYYIQHYNTKFLGWVISKEGR